MHQELCDIESLQVVPKLGDLTNFVVFFRKLSAKQVNRREK